MNRRHFLGWAAAAGTGALLPAASRSSGRRPRLLLRESLQYINIGDSGRVAGLLRLLGRHLPQVEVTLWPYDLHPQDRLLYTRVLPGLKIAEGELDARGRASTPALREAWEGSDFLLLTRGGRGRNYDTLDLWRRTGRPYGMFGGASFAPVGGRDERIDGGTLAELSALIDAAPRDHFRRRVGDPAVYEQAAFLYCRDTLSLRYLRHQGIGNPRIAFGPEPTLAIDARDDRRAADYLRRQGLERERFICVVPRLRYTPYYRVHHLPRSEADYVIDEINDRTAEADHAKLRDLIVAWVRNTGLKVLVCPEMNYQIETAKEFLVQPLPAEVRAQVVWRDSFWAADEPTAIYAQACAVVSIECHSPLMALANGTPAFYVRQPTDTVKGQMYHDLGLSDWIFEIDEISGETLWQRLHTIHRDLPGARARVRTLQEDVARQHRDMLGALARALG